MWQHTRLWLVLIGCFYATTVFAQSQAQHSDPVASVILWVTLIYFFAIIGRSIAERFKQPAVLGELLMGVFLGNLCYFFGLQLVVILREGSAVFSIMRDMLNGIPLAQAVSASIPTPYYANQVTAALSQEQGIDLIKIAYVLDIFARYGVIFLLFKVGLETSIEELKNTGRESIKVALIGIIAPIILGFLIACLLMPTSNYKAQLFVAATLSATSIGITARVLSELKKLRTREARTILGAAMIDDILGLIILAVVSSIVISGVIDFMIIVQIILSAILFFTGILLFGPWLVRKTIYFFHFLDLWELKLFTAFIFAMALAWLATIVHLASIIGAFAAGLILHDEFFESRANTQSIKNLISPLESLLTPLFFMLIGIQVKLETFYNWQVILIAIGLLIAAILGKIISGLGGNRKDDRLLIGIGMLPRGEVGLVFASLGRTLGVMSDELFSAIILMVIITTVIAAPLLKARYAKGIST